MRSEIIGSTRKSKYSNLTEDEWKALEELNNNQNDGKLVIQPTDKNGGICILDRDDYVEEANRQLFDVLKNENGEESKYYEKSSEKAVKDQFKTIQKQLKRE